MAETLEARVASSTTPLHRRKQHLRVRCSTVVPSPPFSWPLAPSIAAPKLHPSSRRGRRRRRPCRRTPWFPGSLAPPLAAVGYAVPIPAAGHPPCALHGQPRPAPAASSTCTWRRRGTESRDRSLSSVPFSPAESFSGPAGQQQPSSPPVAQRSAVARSIGPLRPVRFFSRIFFFFRWTNFQTAISFEP